VEICPIAHKKSTAKYAAIFVNTPRIAVSAEIIIAIIENIAFNAAAPGVRTARSEINAEAAKSVNALKMPMTSAPAANGAHNKFVNMDLFQ
jgi:hypothetical protein